jgi:hypothetical protein
MNPTQKDRELQAKLLEHLDNSLNNDTDPYKLSKNQLYKIIKCRSAVNRIMDDEDYRDWFFDGKEVKQLLKMAGPIAMLRLLEIATMDWKRMAETKTATSVLVSACKDILDRAGIVKESKNIVKFLDQDLDNKTPEELEAIINDQILKSVK